MISILVIGTVLAVLGIYSVLKGKIPCIKNYNGVNNIPLHARIEGGAAVLTGFVMMTQYFIHMEPVVWIISIIGICVIAFILEIALKVI